MSVSCEIFMASTQEIGKLGEDVALKFLEKKGWKIIERNYRKKIGEIDLIGQKNKKLLFVEVKSISCENFERIEDVSPPEERVDKEKQRKIRKTIEIYFSHRRLDFSQTDFEFHVVSVFLYPEAKRAVVRHLENVILE